MTGAENASSNKAAAEASTLATNKTLREALRATVDIGSDTVKRLHLDRALPAPALGGKLPEVHLTVNITWKNSQDQNVSAVCWWADRQLGVFMLRPVDPENAKAPRVVSLVPVSRVPGFLKQALESRKKMVAAYTSPPAPAAAEESKKRSAPATTTTSANGAPWDAAAMPSKKKPRKKKADPHDHPEAIGAVSLSNKNKKSKASAAGGPTVGWCPTGVNRFCFASLISAQPFLSHTPLTNTGGDDAERSLWQDM